LSRSRTLRFHDWPDHDPREGREKAGKCTPRAAVHDNSGSATGLVRLFSPRSLFACKRLDLAQ
jgi:hypothetical protein